MLTIRLQRVGKKNNPAYRVVLVDSRRAAQTGRFLEILGSYNPQHKDSLMLQKERITHWLSKGVQTSDTMHNLLVREQVIDAPKRNVLPPSKLKKAKEQKAEKQSAPTVEPTPQVKEDAAKADQPAVEEKQSEKEKIAEEASSSAEKGE